VSKPTFKVPQVSVLFNFQGPAVLSLWGVPPDSLYIIPPPQVFVNTFFQISTKLNSKLICGGSSHKIILFAVVLF
ncbi:hypothetical protein, partial [uncultured Gemmiger sp.]|uniref:hypothetical protein n=1 Tax=uncultured Gemmiger sp. TaxID=1623490 RepID=UPI0025E63362